jgi:putative membrane protein
MLSLTSSKLFELVNCIDYENLAKEDEPLASNVSMNDYIERAVKRYSSLFTLPSHTTLLLSLSAICLIDGVIIAITLGTTSLTSVAIGLGLGVILFTSIMVTDFVIHFTSFQGDLIFDLRRCSALSVYSTVLWSAFIVLGVLTNPMASGLLFKFFLLGFCAVVVLRLLVLWTISFANLLKVSFYTVLMPTAYAIPVVLTACSMGTNMLNASAALFFSLSLFILLSALSVFLYSLNRVGVQLLGVGSFSILKAFLANWTEDLTEPFEQFFERYGVPRDIKVSALAFKAKDKLKTVMIVPAFHPGPFKNIGSSTLPFHIQKLLENKLPNCLVAVPHGLSGHDLDLTSQTQNQLVLNGVEKMIDFSSFSPMASSFVRIKKKGASVSCQLFNNCSLVSLTLAPETMEDLPPELDSFIIDEAHKHRLATAISVDAHNSILNGFDVNAALAPLKEAAVACLKKASTLKPQPFELGVARVEPNEFSLAEGLGQGGIVATVVKTGKQTVAYVTIDGNNMVSGLREKILSAVAQVGIDDGEVFTTDTHAVNAVVLTARGYHPVGEAMNHELLINYVKQAVVAALGNLEPVQVAWHSETIPNVKIIGEQQIEAMCVLVDWTVRRAKKLAIAIFPLVGVALSALLLLL